MYNNLWVKGVALRTYGKFDNRNLMKSRWPILETYANRMVQARGPGTIEIDENERKLATFRSQNGSKFEKIENVQY